MNRLFAVSVVALSVLVGCGGEDSTPPPGNNNPNGNTNPTQTCGASNCAGCCFNNVCQTGTAASACGKAGATCGTCGAAQVCKADQTCGVDPGSRWLVQPTSAGINPNNNGSSWDGEGSPPDVFVRMKCPGAAVTETPESESYSPTWTSGGCIAQASALLAEPWVFQVWDSDVSSNDTITSPLGYQFTEEALTAGTVILQASGGMKSLTLQVRKQP